MTDVAREAGVSRVTVSRVLSAPDSVAPRTRAIVEATIARLGFVANLNAGTLASSRSRIIGALVPTLSNAWFADTIDGLSAALSAARYQLLLGQTRYDEHEEGRLVDAFIGRRVDAMVLTGTQHAPGVRQRLQRQGMPVVECWELSESPIDTIVGFSNSAAGSAVAQHLASRGCRRLGFIGAQEHRSAQRLQGFRQAAQSLGLGEVRAHLVLPPSSVREGARGLQEMMAADPSIDGVFCSNDTLALGALLTSRQNAWQVPARIAIVGFSDLAVAEASYPPLTTVRIDSRAMGQKIADLLLQRLAGMPPPQQRMHDLGFQLIVRESA